MVGALLPYVNDTMSEIELTESDLEVGAYIEYTALGGLLGDDETHSGTITGLRTKTVQHVSEPDEEKTIIVLSDGEDEHEVAAKTLTDQTTHESDNSGFTVDEFTPADDDGDEDDLEVVTDGGEDVTEHVDDETIQTSIKQNDQPGHPDALTVDDVRDLLAHIHTGVEHAWDTYMDHVEDGNAEVVHESRDLVILSTGDHDWVSEELDHYDGDVQIDRTAKTVVSQVHHMVAKQHCDYDWSVSYPFVMVKPDSYDAGERFVTAVVNGLQARGLSPGQAWAYFGVEIKGNSMNNWGVRKGDHDHKNVSDALETAKQKLPEAF